MAIPSEYETPRTNAGATNMSHPVETITVYTGRYREESIGPITNLKTGTVLHPDMHDSDPDRGRANIGEHAKQMSTWVPGLTGGDNLVLKGGVVETATLQGLQAVYIKELAETMT